jgi:hypothetical protein
MTYKKTNNSDELHKMLKSNISMTNSNEKILIQDGIVTFINDGGQIDLHGKLMFNWLPNMAVRFYGSFPKDSQIKDFQFFYSNPKIKIENNVEVFELNGLSLNLNESNNTIDIMCQLTPPIVIGEKGRKVNKVIFELPNLRGFIGKQAISDSSAYKNTLIFNNGEYEIILERSKDYPEINRQLENNGGYQLIFTGKITSLASNTFSISESEIILDQFAYFLQFINGSRSSPIFRYGYSKNSVVWRSYTPYETDSFKNVTSWAKISSTNSFNDLWIKFSSKWKSENDRECLKTILHWYIEANRNSTKLEGSIVLIQNALELLFHWIIGESEKYVTSSDATSISAAAKIGFLLALFDISPEIPQKLSALKKYEKENNILNGPELFISIRNCIVHPYEKKRKTLKGLDSIGRYQTLTLGISYVEIILLKFLDFKGDYRNRAEEY